MNARATLDLGPLQERLGYPFKKPELLNQALTHRSHSKKNNERLEFLGDSVLNCAVAEILYERYSDLDEGDLSRVRANLVKQQALYEIAQGLLLSDYLKLGEGELKSGGFRRPSILADTLEAITGAIFIDGGFDAAKASLRKLYSSILQNVDPKTLGKDDKTLLQEYLQGFQLPLPAYNVVGTSGAAHNQRAAEQVAAKLALAAVQKALPQESRKPKKTRAAKKKAAKADTGKGQLPLKLKD
jgi:ribonuclease-3